MRCDFCGELRQYVSEIVAVTGSPPAARIEAEDTPPLEPLPHRTGRYHAACYAAARKANACLPAIQP